MSTELATRPTHPLVAIVAERLPEVATAIPPNTINAERLAVAFRSALNKTPALAKCSQTSWVAALLNCAALGIIPNTLEQHAYLIPRGGECNLEIGYRGFIHMMMRGGEISSIDSDVVRDGDEWEFQKGDPVICRFKANYGDPTRDHKPIIAAYCLVRFKNGDKKLEVMDASDLRKVEAKSMKGPAWKDWRSEMLRKAPIKRLAKTTDLGPLVAKASDLDNAAFERLHPEPTPLILPSGQAVEIQPRLRDIGPADQDGEEGEQ